MAMAFGTSGAVSAPSPRRAESLWVEDILPVDFNRIGIDKQLVRIEPEAALRRVVAVGAKAVARSGFQARHEASEHTVRFGRELQALGFAISVIVEDRNPDAFR